MTARIQVRRDASDNWQSANPILSQGEWGYNIDNKGVKIGDGVTAWNSLSYHVLPFGSYTPTVSQGASTDIAKTVNYCKYSVNVNVVNVVAKITPSGAGTSGSAIAVSLPVTAATAAVGTVIGSGYYNDGGVQYQAVAYLLSTTTVAFLSTHGTASTSTDDPIGVNPNIAVANADVINFQCVYEAA